MPMRYAGVMGLIAGMLFCWGARESQAAEAAPVAEPAAVAAPAAEPAPTAGSMELEDMYFYEFAPVTVASSWAEETVFNSVSTVSVIDRDMIKRFNFTTVSQAVETVAGFMAWRTYLKNRLPISRGLLQDHYANKVLVMINNVPAWHAVTGEGDLDRVDISDVERIEVLKGPASVLYGSNAYSGAVNIVLRKAKPGKSQGFAHGGLGSGAEGFRGPMGSQQAGASYSQSEGDLQYRLSANSRKEIWPQYIFNAEGTAATNRMMVNEYLDLANVTFSGQYGGHSWLINSVVNHELYLGVTPQRSAGVDRDHEIELHLANYAYHYKWEQLQANYSLTFDWSRRNYSRSFDDNTRADIVGSRLMNQLNASYSFWNDWNIEAGADHELRYSTAFTNYLVYEDRVITENNMRDRRVAEGSGYVQLGYSHQPLKVLVGTRATQNELFGTNVSSRGTIVCTLDETNSVKLIVGQSYRAPSLFELNFVTLPQRTVFGNSELKPELATSAELAYLTKVAGFFVQALGYYAIYENSIGRALGSATYDGVTYNNVNVYQNGDRIIAKGAELEVEYRLPTTRIFASGDYVDGDDGDRIYESATNSYTWNFKYVPHWTASGGATQNLGPFTLSALINYYGDMHGRVSLIPANFSVDASLAYQHGNIRHTLAARNLANNNMTVPEYARRTLNEIPLIHGIRVDYGFSLEF
ncbi:MAG: TonB-dependent receptor plug domain-containing protein [candidate division FCPU426 bacterium]